MTTEYYSQETVEKSYELEKALRKCNAHHATIETCSCHDFVNEGVICDHIKLLRKYAGCYKIEESYQQYAGPGNDHICDVPVKRYVPCLQGIEDRLTAKREEDRKVKEVLRLELSHKINKAEQPTFWVQVELDETLATLGATNNNDTFLTLRSEVLSELLEEINPPIVRNEKKQSLKELMASF